MLKPAHIGTEITADAPAPFGWTRFSKTKRTLRALGTLNREVAMKRVLKMEADGDKASKTILEATESFIRDAEARGLRAPASLQIQTAIQATERVCRRQGFHVH